MPRGVALVIAALASGAAFAVATPAWASPSNTEVLVNEPFTGTSMSSSNWTVPAAPSATNGTKRTNVACLTAGASTTAKPVPGCSSTPLDSSGTGALRLTPDVTNDEGGVAYDLSVPTTDGIDATFDSYQYGEAPGNAADGIGFFLAAADPTDPQPPTSIGQPGGSLGYSAYQDSSTTPTTVDSGMTHGYLGIGLDVFGNYTNKAFEGTGCADASWEATVPNNVSVRGPGNGTTGYCMQKSTLSSAALPANSLDSGAGGTRSNSRVRVEVVINPSSSSVTSATYGITVPAHDYAVAFMPLGASTYQTLSGTLPDASTYLPSGWYDPATGIPYQLTFGWVGSTGGSKEVHEVNNVESATASGIPATLTTSVSDDAGGAPASGSTIDNQVTVGNKSGSDTDSSPITVTDTLPSGETPSSTGLGGDGWSCSISGQKVSCTNVGPLAGGATLPQLVIPATVTATAGTQLTNSLVASSDDSDPTSEQNSVTVATPPTDTSTCNSPDGLAGWFITAPVCTVQGTDPSPGIDHVAYTLDNTTVTTHSGATSADVPITTDGTHSLTTEVFNASGQGSGSSATRTLDVDTTPPADTSTCGTPAGHNGYFTTDPTCTVQGTDSVSGVDHIAYQLDGDAPVTTPSGATTATLPITTEGPHTLTTTIYNAAGLDSGQHTQTIHVDTTPPADVTTCPTPDGSPGWFTSDPSCSVTGTDATSGVDHVVYRLDGTVHHTASGTTTADVPIATDGAHTLKTKVVDAAGLSSGWSSHTIDVDTTPPSDTSTCGTPTGQNGYFASDPTCDAKGTDPASGVDHVAYRIDGGSTVATSSGTATARFPITTDGTHTIETKIVDAAGLSSGWRSETIKVLTRRPAAPVVTAPANGSLTSIVSPTVTVTGAPGDRVTVQVDGIGYGPVILDGSGDADVRIPGPLSDGQHTVRAEQTDVAGNVSPWSPTSTWTVKTSTSAQLSGPTGGPTDVTTPVVDYAGEPGDQFTITIDGHPVASGVIPAGGAGSLTLPAPLADGPHTIEVTTTDAAGNRASRSIVVTIDTDGPGTPRIVSAPGDVTASTSATFTFADRKPGVSYQCSLDGGGWKDCPSTVTFSTLSQGPHSLQVRAVDPAGNISPSTQDAWTVKSTPPPAPTVLSGPSRYTIPSRTSFAISSQPGTTLQCSLDGGRFKPCSRLVALRRLPTGHHALAVRQVDEAGNVSPNATYHWTVLHRAGSRGLPRQAATLVAHATTAYGDRGFAAGCQLNAGSVRSCRVVALYHGRRVGQGTGTVARRGHTGTVVNVRLNARGRRLLRQALGGLPVTLRSTVKPFGFHRLPAGASTVLYAPLRILVPDVLFGFDRSTLTAGAHRIVRTIAADVNGARRVVCEGNTDSYGSRAYNRRLGLRRAKTVCAALRALGVHVATGTVSYGYNRPVASNGSAAGRQLNRRVVVAVSYDNVPPTRRHPTTAVTARGSHAAGGRVWHAGRHRRPAS